ncbi:MAG TPA: hypothetical protein VG318_18480 [Actinomycetota bacterium]|nr:hypothetical protein [Actinomycetota bacterium]
MKKLLGAAFAAACLVAPATPAAASDALAGTDECWAGQTGIVVWVWDPIEQERDYFRLCIQTGP